MNGSFSNLRRRDFLRLAAAGGLALSIPLVASKVRPYFSSDIQSPAFSTSFNAIGTTVWIIIDDEISSGFAQSLVNSLSEQVNSLGQVLTRFSGGTDLCDLNQAGEIEGASSSLLTVLNSSIGRSEQTSGSFDVTVKPVLDLLQAYLEGQPFPSDSQFDEAKSLIDYQNISISGSGASFNKPGMGITLDGIATGYILDQSIAFFKSKGINSALINFGGTLATIGSRLDGSRWKVGITDPVNTNTTIGNVYLKDQAVATTGDYEDYYTPNKEYYQIIDPQTGRSPLFSHSATVVAPTAFLADPLGVALMVEAPEDAMKLIDSFPAECLIYTDSNEIMTSSGMKELMTA